MRTVRVLAAGQLLMDPQLIASARRSYARICLMDTVHRRLRAENPARSPSGGVWFVAFDAIAGALARHVRAGDHVELEACVRTNALATVEAMCRFQQVLVVKRFRLSVRQPRLGI